MKYQANIERNSPSARQCDVETCSFRLSKVPQRFDTLLQRHAQLEQGGRSGWMIVKPE